MTDGARKKSYALPTSSNLFALHVLTCSTPLTQISEVAQRFVSLLNGPVMHRAVVYDFNKHKHNLHNTFISIRSTGGK